MLECIVNEDFLGTLLTVVATIVGGACSFLGSKYVISKEIKNQNQHEKNKIILDYYALLSKYFNFINDINHLGLEQLVHDFINEFDKNGYFVFYIREQWFKVETEKFFSSLNNELENKKVSQGDIKKNILNLFNEMKECTVKKIKGVQNGK